VSVNSPSASACAPETLSPIETGHLIYSAGRDYKDSGGNRTDDADLVFEVLNASDKANLAWLNFRKPLG
jgi:hypothetical protein